MTCRMLVAVGKLSLPKILNSFELVALNRNEKHELNRNNRNFVHSDGWGIVLGKSGKIEEFYKKDIACWKDPKFLEYHNADADLIILHARKASPGSPINCSYTHPFEKEGWYFCYNGTVKNPPANDHRDSEQFFQQILANLQEAEVEKAIRTTLSWTKDYTALNFILANSERIFVIVKYDPTLYPEYYTMKYLQNQGQIIVSSETLSRLDGTWTLIENNTLVSIDVKTRKLEIEMV